MLNTELDQLRNELSLKHCLVGFFLLQAELTSQMVQLSVDGFSLLHALLQLHQKQAFQQQLDL